MVDKREELANIVARFAESGWNWIDEPSKAWLENNISNEELLSVIKQADQECGSCGCEFDLLYKRAIELLQD